MVNKIYEYKTHYIAVEKPKHMEDQELAFCVYHKDHRVREGEFSNLAHAMVGCQNLANALEAVIEDNEEVTIDNFDISGRAH